MTKHFTHERAHQVLSGTTQRIIESMEKEDAADLLATFGAEIVIQAKIIRDLLPEYE